MDQEMRTYLEGMEARLDERFSRVDERFSRLEARMEERFSRVDEEVRHTRVLVESVDDSVRLVAEGVMGVTERLENFQRETALQFEEVKASIAPYYRNLDGRVKALEAKADRQTEDVLESIRKKFGKPQA